MKQRRAPPALFFLLQTSYQRIFSIIRVRGTALRLPLRGDRKGLAPYEN